LRPSRSRVGFLVAVAVTAVAPVPAAAGPTPQLCEPGGDPVVLDGDVTGEDLETYLLLPVEVGEGTTRIEVGYEWADTGSTPDGENDTVLDLGIWDEDGTSGADAFRGWSGSRQGLTADGQDPVFIQADEAERGFVAGEIQPGTWNVELGVGFVPDEGATYEVTVTCSGPEVGPPAALDPVDPDHVADPEAGWYVGDLHLHAYHSNPEGLAGQEMVDAAVANGLDFIPVTEYVTPAHWTQLGQVQEDNPDVVIWPGREVITYGGHAIVLGETPDTVEYQASHLGAVQDESRAQGALFGIAHPTIFPGEAGAELCRGCEFTLADEIEWSAVDTLEVVTTGALLDADFDPAPVDGTVENPFVATAIDLWEEQLAAGNHITAVGGSDDKQGDQYGSAATEVFAEQLSRDALADGLQAGRAYVLARGVEESPRLAMTAVSPEDGSQAMFGETVVGQRADVDVNVTRGDGQTLHISRNGEEVEVVPVEGDDFTYSFSADRADDEGPLGTFWRIDTYDDRSITAVGNPVFLADELPAAEERPEPTLYADVHASDQPISTDPDGDVVDEGSPLPWAILGVGVLLLGGAAGAAYVRRRSRSG
jgi:hypothetical protein